MHYLDPAKLRLRLHIVVDARKLRSRTIALDTMAEVSTASPITSIAFPKELSTTSDRISTGLPQATASTNDLQPLPEASSSDYIATRCFDSGYASTVTTHERASSRKRPSDEVLLPSSRKRFQRKPTKLRIFDQEISESVQNRFSDLKELFDKPLYDYLSKAQLRSTTMSIKLKVAGESEATAKPWIVVMCDKAISKKVKRFFNQPLVKSEYESREINSDMPSFGLVICDRPPRQMANTRTKELYAHGWNNIRCFKTLCGISVKTELTGKARIATLGGIVKAKNSEGGYTLYGMTAGHLIPQEQVEEEDLDLDSCYEEHREDEDEDRDYVPSDTEEFELDLTFDGDEATYEFDGRADASKSKDQFLQTSFCWLKIGSAFRPSSQDAKEKENLDWALIEIADPSEYRPNLLMVPDGHYERDTSLELKEISYKLKGTKPDRPIVLMSGTGGLKLGTLSTALSFLMLAPGKSFVGTYILTLSNGFGMTSFQCLSMFNANLKQTYALVIVALGLLTASLARSMVTSSRQMLLGRPT